MEQWNAHINQYTEDAFWREAQPAFHAYDYGANIEIEPTDSLEHLPPLTRLCPVDEESDSDAGLSEEEEELITEGPRSQHCPSTESTISPDPSSYTENLYSSGLHQL
jgi:hypothetical protein